MEQAGSDEVVLTPAGYGELEQELERLRNVRRSEVAARLRQALEFAGDLGDDPDYLDAIRERDELEQRIERLETRLAQARVLEPATVPSTHVVLGSWVELEDLDTGTRSRYQLVSSAEAAPAQGRLSVESPVGRAVAGHTVRQTVEAATPHGPRRLRIVGLGAGGEPLEQ